MTWTDDVDLYLCYHMAPTGRDGLTSSGLTKWPTFCGHFFQKHFLERKYMGSYFSEILSYWQSIIIDLSQVLAPNLRQTIARANNAPYMHIYMYAPPCLNGWNTLWPITFTLYSNSKNKNRGMLVKSSIFYSLPWGHRCNPYTLIARFMGPTWAHLGPTGPRWAPCWPHEPCYLGSSSWKITPSWLVHSIAHVTKHPVTMLLIGISK